MHKRRLLSYKYFTLNFFLQGCTQCQELDFFIGPKDTVHPVEFVPKVSYSKKDTIYDRHEKFGVKFISIANSKQGQARAC